MDWLHHDPGLSGDYALIPVGVCGLFSIQTAWPPTGRPGPVPGAAPEAGEALSPVLPGQPSVHSEASGRQFVLEGYLRVDEPESFRLLAKGDMGGTVFELQQVKGEKPQVVKNQVSLRPAWLLEGAARDISAQYFGRHNLRLAWSGIRPGTGSGRGKLSPVFGKNFASSQKPAACLLIC